MQVDSISRSIFSRLKMAGGRESLALALACFHQTSSSSSSRRRLSQPTARVHQPSPLPSYKTNSTTTIIMSTIIASVWQPRKRILAMAMDLCCRQSLSVSYAKWSTLTILSTRMSWSFWRVTSWQCWAKNCPTRAGGRANSKERLECFRIILLLYCHQNVSIQHF